MKNILIYDTMTLNTKYFAEKVKKNSNNKIEIINIKDINDEFMDNNFNFHLVTYTIMQGEIPKTTLNFLNKYSEKIKTISSTGQKNWGSGLFAIAVDEVNKLFKIKKGLKIELQGTQNDVYDLINIMMTE